MIPCPISEDGINHLSQDTIDIIHRLDHFIVERARTARRFIKSTQHPSPIQNLVIMEMDKHDPSHQVVKYLQPLKEGISIGILSEAGCPGIADPGNLFVQKAYEYGIPVVPHVGPSSIILALMASGQNGQNFAFIGYLPNKKPQLAQRLKQLESHIIRTKQCQIFIETPYKNGFLLGQIISQCQKNMKLTIACDINDTEEYIQTHSISKWNESKLPDLHKRPAIFILGV